MGKKTLHTAKSSLTLFACNRHRPNQGVKNNEAYIDFSKAAHINGWAHHCYLQKGGSSLVRSYLLSRYFDKATASFESL